MQSGPSRREELLDDRDARRHGVAFGGPVPAPALATLPCDRDYLGTRHLVRAAPRLDARGYVAEHYPLLELYPARGGGAP